MGVNTEAASDPGTDNAGQAMGIDAAIDAALGASETKGLSAALKETAPEKSSPKVKTRAEAKAEAKVETKPEDDASAGDKPTDEHAEDEGEASKPEETEEEATTSFEAPKHWPEADRKAFVGLPKDGQDIVLKIAKNLQGGYTRKSQELSDQAKFATEVRGLFNDADRQQMARAGVDERQMIDHLVRLQRYATQDGPGYIKWAMHNLGVTPEALFGPQTQPPPGQTQQPPADDNLTALLADPAVKQLEAKLAQLQGIVEGNERQKQEAARYQQINAVNAINRELATFRQALDDTGQLKFPHFDTVRAHMGALMDTDPDLAQLADGQDKLQKAYDMAVWARPDLRQGFVEAEAQKRIQEAQKKQDAVRAKKATAIKPAAGVVSTRPKVTSLDDAISSSLSKFGL